MTGPLFRFGLIVACTGWLLGLVLIAGWQGPVPALLIGVLGAGTAVGLYELRDRPVEEQREPQRARPRRPVGARQVEDE